MAPMSIASPLREIAQLKVDQFNQLKEDFTAHYQLDALSPTDLTPSERIITLLKKVKQYDSYLNDDEEIAAISQQVEQIGEDFCLSEDKLFKFEKQIMDKLRKRLSRYEATSLHLDLMKEAMESDRSRQSSSSGLNALSLEDDFELVDNGLEALWEEFEAEAFTAKDVDVEALETYLELLSLNHDILPTFNSLREKMRRYGEKIIDGDIEIEEDELEWCIMDLLKNDLISDEKKKTLESYIQSQTAVRELLGVLNMKSISQWNWKQTSDGVPVAARQDSKGQYHITVEEDIIDTLFLHCSAVGWAQKLKECLSRYAQHIERGGSRSLSASDRKERQFFLAPPPPEPCLVSTCPPPPPPPPPPEVYMGVPHIMPRTKPKKKAPRPYAGPMSVMPPPPPPPPLPIYHLEPTPPPPPSGYPFPMSPLTLDDERYRLYKQDFFMSRLPIQIGCRPKVVSAEAVQANLIKTLATEIRYRAVFDEQPSCLVVNFHSLAKALPHKTVLAVLKFLGVPEPFVDFFARYLAVNLNIGPSVRGTRDRILTRACGVPDRHGLELLFTEAVMFFAELAVTKEVGLPMYRLGSTCYFVGTEEQSDAVLKELTIFSQHTKLDFDEVNMQRENLHIGLLQLTGTSVTLKLAAIEAHAQEVKRTLSAQKTVYDWVRVWNSTLGTYAAHLFGPLIHQFGKPYLKAVRDAYNHMYGIIFESGDLTHHVKSMLCVRSDFARSSPPLALEAMIYMPQSFGGLGVKNPMIALSLARNISPDSNAIIQDYLDMETKYYEIALDNWSKLTPEHITQRLSAIFPNEEDIAATLGNGYTSEAFISKEHLTRHREYAPFPHIANTLLYGRPRHAHQPDTIRLYSTLLLQPVDDLTDIANERLRDEVRECGPCKRWGQLSTEDRWLLQMYGDECLERYGSLDIWCERYVPRICLMMARGLDGTVDEDGSSLSYTSSVTNDW